MKVFSFVRDPPPPPPLGEVNIWSPAPNTADREEASLSEKHGDEKINRYAKVFSG